MNITATHIAYFLVCKRKLWLFSHSVNMEHTSEVVYEGKLISETTYPQRAQKYTELSLGSVKIDFYDAQNKVVHEVKKSNKVEQAHEWQVKYYLLTLERNGVEGATGIIEYPKLRSTREVKLDQKDRHFLTQAEQEISKLMTQDECPDVINKPICKRCSYFEFCYV